MVSFGVLGATSIVGVRALVHLASQAQPTWAFSRSVQVRPPEPSVTWQVLDPVAQPLPASTTITHWLCFCPIWALSAHFGLLQRHGARRVLALSSTSLLTKAAGNGSADPAELAVVAQLKAGEQALAQWADAAGVEWIVLRPTLIYDFERDKNLTEIAHFIARFGCFPLLGAATGLRQPVHADDVALAALDAVVSSLTSNTAYNIAGSETMSYRAMVTQVFHRLAKTPRFVVIPIVLFKWALVCLRWLPRYRKVSVAMVERMNRDLVFDTSAAHRDFGYRPRQQLSLPLHEGAAPVRFK